MRQRLLVKNSMALLGNFKTLPPHFVLALLINTVYSAAIGFLYLWHPEVLMSSPTEALTSTAIHAGCGSIAMAVLSLTALIVCKHREDAKGALVTLSVFHVSMACGYAALLLNGGPFVADLVAHVAFGSYFAFMTIQAFDLRMTNGRH